MVNCKKNCENEEMKVSSHLFKEVSGIILTTLCLMVAPQVQRFHNDANIRILNEQAQATADREFTISLVSLPFYLVFIIQNAIFSSHRSLLRAYDTINEISVIFDVHYFQLQVSRSKWFGFYVRFFSPKKKIISTNDTGSSNNQNEGKYRRSVEYR